MTHDDLPPGITEQPAVTGPKKQKRRRERNVGLPKTADDVKAMLAVTNGKTMVDMVSEATEMRMQKQLAELELEKLRKKVAKNPNYLREGLDRALAIAGETPAETLVKLLHQRDGSGRYTLDARERLAIAKALLPYTVPAFKAQETKQDGNVGVTVVVQNYSGTKPEVKRGPVIELKDGE